MCGRLDGDYDRLEFTRLFGLELPRDWPGAFAVAPTMPYPVIRLPPGGRVEAVTARWSLVPMLYRGLLRQFRHSTFNARLEDVAGRPTYSLAWRQGRRCLVPVRGFYEWSGPKSARVPYRVARQDGRPLVLGGLWETWYGEFGRLETFTVLTTTANGLLAPLHDRMPVILERSAWRAWLDPRTRGHQLEHLVAPFHEDVLAVQAVTQEETRPMRKTSLIVAA